MDIKISIIMPVYNVEKFLKKSIQSVINQTFKEFELILIDDGSKDKSGDICDYYSKLDNRIVVKHTTNKGVSAARNLGLDIARGNYIGFVDSDDIIEKQMFEILYNEIITGKYDIVKCDVKEIKYLSEEYIDYDNNYIQTYDSREIKGNEDIFVLFLKCELSACCYDKLFKKEIIGEKRFKNITVNEDLDFLLQVMPYLNNIKLIYYPFYKYVRRENSITTSFYSQEKLKTIDIHKDILKYCKNNYPQYIDCALNQYYGEIMLVMHYICYKSKDKELFDVYIRLAKELRKNIISIIFNNYITIKNKIILLIMSSNRKIYMNFISIINNLNNK